MSIAKRFRLRPPPDPEQVEVPTPAIGARGRLLYAEEVAQLCFQGRKTARWVVAHYRHLAAGVPGNRLMWWSDDVMVAIATTVSQARGTARSTNDA